MIFLLCSSNKGDIFVAILYSSLSLLSNFTLRFSDKENQVGLKVFGM